MRKQVIHVPQIAAAWDQGSLDLEQSGLGRWKMRIIQLSLRFWETRRQAGVRLSLELRRYDSFSTASKLMRIFLAFEDNEAFRTQEFVLRWSSRVGQPFREIVRQQWNFSSPGAVRAIENYAVDL